MKQKALLHEIYKRRKLMRILGISLGQKLGNNEILVKEALKGAEAQGAEVAFLRTRDFDIKPCTGCNACVMRLEQAKPPAVS
jgi:multimeric flavodoxin WrbA